MARGIKENEINTGMADSWNKKNLEMADLSVSEKYVYDKEDI